MPRLRFILGHKPYIRLLIAAGRRGRLLGVVYKQYNAIRLPWVANVCGGGEVCFDSEFRAASWLRRQFSTSA